MAIEENAESYEAWLNLGCVAKRLFEISGREDHYFKAVGCLQKASTLNPDHFNIWLKWGQLLAFNAKLRRDIQLLEESSEKFSMADRCDPQHPIVISDWAEVLILMGGYYEKIELLKEAEKKIVKGIELYPTNPQLWYSYGSCLNELGRYFEDEEYFELAIEKFQYALSMNRELPYVWYGLGTSYFSLGDIRGDIQLFEKASRNYSKALDFGGVFSPQFWNDWGVVMMKIAEISQDQHHVELAVEKFEKAISIQESIEPKNIDPHWLYNYGCALDFLGDFGEDEIYYEKAVQILTQALNLDPNFSHAQYNLALSLSHLGEITMDVDCFHKANELFQEVIHHDSEDEMAWNEWGLSLLNLAQLTKDPSHPELANELYAQAESRFLTATALGCVHAYYNLACFYSLRGNYPCSMHFIEKAEQASALPSIEDMMNDEWLEGVRSTSEFRAFLIQLSAKYPQSEDEFNS